MGGQRFRQSTGKEDYEQARLVAEDWALGLKGVERWGGGVKKARRPFSVAADQFIDELEVLTEGERSSRHVKHNRARIKNHLSPFFGDRDVSEITSGLIYDYRIHRLKVGPLPRGPKSAKVRAEAPDAPLPRLAKSTLHQEIVCLRQILKAELRRGTIVSLPDMSAPHKASGKTAHRAWFSQDEYKKLREETRNRAEKPPHERYREGYEDLHDCVLFLVNTGLRPDEALKLELRDVTVGIDDETQERILTIEVRGKVGYGPCKSMPGAVLPFQRLMDRRRRRLRKALGKLSNPAGVKLDLSPTTPLFPELHWRLLNSVLEALNLKKDREGRPRTFYSLRHTYICLRLLDGAHPWELAKNCRTSVEMIDKHYAVHLKNYVDASLINVRKKKENVGAGTKKRKRAKAKKTIKSLDS